MDSGFKLPGRPELLDLGLTCGAPRSQDRGGCTAAGGSLRCPGTGRMGRREAPPGPRSPPGGPGGSRAAWRKDGRCLTVM